MEIIAESQRISRKKHRCNFCGIKINKGERYKDQFCKSDGIYHFKSHIRCFNLAYKLKMFDDIYDEGLTGDSFQQTVCETFKLISSDDFQLVSYETKLNTVLKHYKLIN